MTMEAMEFLHRCWIPIFQPKPRFMYPFGNTQIEDFLEDFVLYDEFDVLLLGMGDIRHILKTIGGLQRSDSSGRTKCARFIVNDVDASMIARNVLLLTIVNYIDGEKLSDIEFLWDVWYNQALLESHYLRLKETLKQLVDELSAPSGKQCWSFGDEKTKDTTKQILVHWSLDKCREYDYDVQNTTNNRGMVSIMMKQPILLYVDSNHFLGPDTHAAYFTESTNYSRSLSARNPRKQIDTKCFMNPTMVRPEDPKTCIAYDVEPWQSYFPMEREFIEKHHSMYSACISVLQAVIKRFKAALAAVEVRISFWTEESLFLCHFGLLSEMTFDLIHTSNVSDYVGLINVLLACSPRLKNKHSVLMTETFRWSHQFADLEAYIAAHIGCHALLLPTVLGLRLAEDFDLGTRALKTTPSIYTIKQTGVQKICWAKQPEKQCILIKLSDSPDLQAYLLHLLYLCMCDNSVEQFPSFDGRCMYTPLTLMYAFRHLQHRVKGGMNELMDVVNSYFLKFTDLKFQHSLTWKILCYAFGVMTQKDELLQLEVTFPCFNDQVESSSTLNVVGALWPARLILNRKIFHRPEILTLFSYDTDKKRFNFMMLKSTWKKMKDSGTISAVVSENNVRATWSEDLLLMDNCAIVRSCEINDVQDSLEAVTAESHFCAEFDEYYIVTIATLRQPKKIKLEKKWLFDENMTTGVILSINASSREYKVHHRLTFSCFLNIHESKFKIRPEHEIIEALIAKETKIGNKGRTALTLRLLNYAELSPYRNAKELKTHLEETELFDLIFCSPLDSMMQHSANLIGEAVTDSFFCLRQIVARLFQQWYENSEIKTVNIRTVDALRDEDVEMTVIICGYFKFKGLPFLKLKLVHTKRAFKLIEENRLSRFEFMRYMCQEFNQNQMRGRALSYLNLVVDEKVCQLMEKLLMINTRRMKQDRNRPSDTDWNFNTFLQLVFPRDKQNMPALFNNLKPQFSVRGQNHHFMDQLRNFQRQSGLSTQSAPTDSTAAAKGINLEQASCGNPSCENRKVDGAIKNLMKCSRCQSISYCSKKCQVDDWCKHKKLCKSKSPTLTNVKSKSNSEQITNSMSDGSFISPFSSPASASVKSLTHQSEARCLNSAEENAQIQGKESSMAKKKSDTQCQFPTAESLQSSYAAPAASDALKSEATPSLAAASVPRVFLSGTEGGMTSLSGSEGGMTSLSSREGGMTSLSGREGGMTSLNGGACECCGAAAAVMKCCAQCRAAYYCSRACQHAGWVTHRLDCSVPDAFDVDIGAKQRQGSQVDASSAHEVPLAAVTTEEKSSTLESRRRESSMDEARSALGVREVVVGKLKKPPQKQCAACGCGGEGNVKVCKGCRVTHYCSRECQSRDWKRHKHQCSAARRRDGPTSD